MFRPVQWLKKFYTSKLKQQANKNPRSIFEKYDYLRQNMHLTLKKIRLEKNLTQIEVAELLGKDQVFVSNCESGRRNLDPVELMSFCSLYGISIKYFYDSIQNNQKTKQMISSEKSNHNKKNNPSCKKNKKETTDQILDYDQVMGMIDSGSVKN